MIHKTMDIWENLPYDGKDSSFRPTLDTYILDNKPVRGSVLVFPGGGYACTSEREAECIAIKFNSAGFNAFVLYYSVAPNRHPQPILDAARAMCIIRENAENWRVDPNKIAVIGFSAGGHLAASIGTLWNEEYLFETKGITKGKTRPDAVILSYPVIMAPAFGKKAHAGSFYNLLGENLSDSEYDEMSLEKKVSPETPPAFIWHTFEDLCVPVENSLEFARALRENGVPFEMHIYPNGGHGLSLATKEVCDENSIDPHVGTWIDLCRTWLNELFKN